MRIKTPVATFSSLESAMSTTLPAGRLWRLLDTTGAIIDGGISDGGVTYPARGGTAISTSMLDLDATYGVEVVSGTLTAEIAAGGTGYSVADVITPAGGIIDFGSSTVGTVATFVVSEIDGGGAGPGVVTGITPSAGTAGYGDYVILPDLTAAVATTVAPAGGTGCTLTISQGSTGVSRNASNELVLTPERAAGAPSTVLLKLAAINGGTAGWWDGQAVEIHFTVGTQTQLTADANLELAPHIGLRLERLGGVGSATAAANSVLANTALGVWSVGAIRYNDMGQVVDTAPDISALDKFALGAVLEQNGAAATHIHNARAQYLDSASKMKPYAATGVAGTAAPWTWTSDTSETDDRQFWYIVAHCGQTAGDQQEYTVTAIQSTPFGWEDR